MNTVYIILISFITFTLLSVSIFYGYRNFISHRHNKDVSIFKDNQTNNYFPLLLNLEEGTQKKGTLTVTVSKDTLESLPSYNKFTFTTSGKSHYSKVYFNTDSINLNGDYFEGAIIYLWFNKPLLAIINTIKKDDKDAHNTIYFRATENLYDVFKPYTTDKDLLNNSKEINKLLVEFNIELHNLISLDIGSIDCDTIEFNDNLSMNTTKETFYTSPFVKMTVKMTGNYFSRSFQINELKNNGETVKIEFPPLKIYSFSAYLWNEIPILLQLETKNSVLYYSTNDQEEWTRLLNDKRKEINHRLTEKETEQYLEDINFNLNHAIFLDIAATENYTYLGKPITVIKHDLGDRFVSTLSVYTHHTSDPLFKLGACMFHSSFIDGLPIGDDIMALSVFKNRGMSCLIQIIHSARDNDDTYYRLERDSKWVLVKDSAELIDVESQLTDIHSYLGPILDLDLGKKINYGLINEPNSNKSYHVTVKFYDVHKPYTIYTHKPSSSTNITSNNEIFSFNNVFYNGRVQKGFFPGSISKARVYLLDDTIPVGIQIYTNNGTVNYINNGENLWTKFNDNDSNNLLAHHEFMKHSNDSNIVVAIDLGLLSYITNVNQKPAFHKEVYGKYAKYTFEYENHPHFKFKGLSFKWNQYNFDSDSLFLRSFIKIVLYFDDKSKIPLAFELKEAQSSLFYANNIDGNWLKFSDLEPERIPPLLDAISTPTLNMFVIDNYVGYVSGRTSVAVVQEDISEKYVKYTHTFGDKVNSKGIIYNGYLIPGLPTLEQTYTISAYFKKFTHSLLIVQNNGKYSSQIYTNNGNDTWNLVTDHYDIIKLLDQTDNKLNNA